MANPTLHNSFLQIKKSFFHQIAYSFTPHTFLKRDVGGLQQSKSEPIFDCSKDRRLLMKNLDSAKKLAQHPLQHIKFKKYFTNIIFVSSEHKVQNGRSYQTKLPAICTIAVFT